MSTANLEKLRRPVVPVFVATTVMLSFISFWRAAAIVLADLASSAYYVGGDTENVIGKSAPWFVPAVMLFSYAVRAVREELDEVRTGLCCGVGMLAWRERYSGEGAEWRRIERFCGLAGGIG